MELGPYISDVPYKTSIHRGFPSTMFDETRGHIVSNIYNTYTIPLIMYILYIYMLYWKKKKKTYVSILLHIYYQPGLWPPKLDHSNWRTSLPTSPRAMPPSARSVRLDSGNRRCWCYRCWMLTW